MGVGFTIADHEKSCEGMCVQPLSISERYMGKLTLDGNRIRRHVGSRTEVVQVLNGEAERVEALRTLFGIHLDDEAASYSRSRIGNRIITIEEGLVSYSINSRVEKLCNYKACRNDMANASSICMVHLLFSTIQDAGFQPCSDVRITCMYKKLKTGSATAVGPTHTVGSPAAAPAGLYGSSGGQGL